MNQAALFGEGEYIINDYVGVTLGVRVNYSDKFDAIAIPNPRLYVNVNPTDWLTFKGGVTSGVLVPQLSYLYDGYEVNRNNIAVYGNTDLKPETSWNYELSAIVDTEYAMLIATGVYTDFSNKIQGIGVQPNAMHNGQTCQARVMSCTFYENLNRSFATGAEVAFKLKPIFVFLWTRTMPLLIHACPQIITRPTCKASQSAKRLCINLR